MGSLFRGWCSGDGYGSLRKSGGGTDHRSADDIGPSNHDTTEVINWGALRNHCQPRKPATGNSMSVSFDKSQVSPGSDFVINVVVNTSQPSRGAQAGLKFDASAMQCNSVTEGNFYKDWATTNELSTMLVPSEASIDNAKGIVSDLGVAALGQTKSQSVGGPPGGAQGQGIVFVYHMTANAGVNKSAVITLTGVAITDENGDSISGVTSTNGQVTIGTP